MIVDFRQRNICARDDAMTIAGFLSLFPSFALCGLIAGAYAAMIGIVLIPIIVVLLVKGMFHRVIARPEGLDVDGELIAWAKTSDPELTAPRKARITAITRIGPQDVCLVFGRLEEIDAVKELRERALFVPPQLGPYRT
jgi:hypothetical protein